MTHPSVLDLDNKLAGLQETWENASVAGEVAEGDYEGEVQDFDFFESKAGELFLKTEIVIRIPRDYDGITVDTVHSLSHPERVSYAKEHLGKLGVDTTQVNMGALIDTLRTVIGTGVAIRIVHNEKGGKKYQNVYINDVLFPPGGNTPQQQAARGDVPPDMDGLPTAPTGGVEVDPDLGF